MIVVGVFQLDVERRVLKGADGEVELSPLATRLLRLLSERPGMVVSRTELIDALWSGNYLVGDPGLNRLISETRKLAQRVSTRALIETVQKSGYRLLPDPGTTTAETLDTPTLQLPPTDARSAPPQPLLPGWAVWLVVLVVAAALLHLLMDSAIGLIWATRMRD